MTPESVAAKYPPQEPLSEAGANRVFEEQTNGVDLVLGTPIRFGLGYGLTSAAMPLGPCCTSSR